MSNKLRDARRDGKVQDRARRQELADMTGEVSIAKKLCMDLGKKVVRTERKAESYVQTTTKAVDVAAAAHVVVAASPQPPTRPHLRTSQPSPASVPMGTRKVQTISTPHHITRGNDAARCFAGVRTRDPRSPPARTVRPRHSLAVPRSKGRNGQPQSLLQIRKARKQRLLAQNRRSPQRQDPRDARLTGVASAVADEGGRCRRRDELSGGPVARVHVPRCSHT